MPGYASDRKREIVGSKLGGSGVSAINLRSFPFQLPLVACGLYLALTLLSYVALFGYLVIPNRERPVFLHGHFWHWTAVSMALWFVSFTLAWFIVIPKPPHN